MKEFNAQTGGRYTYVDDIVNLQELALAFVSIFDDCDNFIISGCQIGSDSIDAGYVYINGKIRRFAGASNITEWPQYLYESNRTETVAYASGDDKVGRNVYGCALSPSLPSTPDPLTGEAPKAIRIDRGEAPLRINDAFFGKYALLIKHPRGGQNVAGDLTVENMKVKGNATANNITLRGNLGTMNVRYDTDNNVVVSLHRNNVPYPYSIKFTQSNIQIINDNGLKTVFDKAGVETPGAYLTNVLKINTIQIDSNGISIPQGTDDQTLYINRIGNGRTYYRNTVIGDGKGNAIIKVTGSTKNVHIQGDLSIDSVAIASLSLKKNKLIQWLDDSSAQIAYVGYNNSNVFEINNTASSIIITATGFVNIGPVIREGGKLLTEKYTTRELLTSELNKKADADNVYTREVSDNKYACLGGGLQQLRKKTHTDDELCGQIGAATKAYSDDTFLSKTKLLQDVKVSSDNDRQTICEHIGAAYAPNYQPKLKDTGWKQTTISNGEYSTKNHVYARQIGNVVCIQGKVTISKADDWYIIIPTSIQPPKHAVSFTYRREDASYWSATIEASSYQLRTTSYSSINGKEIPISITYMV